MMKDQTILILGYSDWDHWRPTHRLAELFSKDNTVIFVERLLSYNDLRWKGMGRINCLKLLKFKPLRRVSEKLFVIQSPPGIPSLIPILSRVMDKQIKELSNHFGKKLQANWIKKYLKQQNIVPTVLFLNHPTDLHLAGYFNEKISCWYVYDELSDIPTDKDYSELINKTEKENIGKIDLVFVSSRRQYDKRKNKHPRIYLTPNACSFSAELSGKNDILNSRKELDNIPHPRIGYIGTIDFRIDFCLLEHLAVNNPDLSLVFIGWINSTVKDEMHKLMSHSNVFFLGAKAQNRISDYIKNLDVGMIPFKINKMTDSMLPVKTFEYLTHGISVVTTPLREILPYSDVLYIANNKTEFLDLVYESIYDNPDEKVSRRISVAKENTWETRADHMSELISARLFQKSQI